MRPDVSQMKWWGWGKEGLQFNIEDKPDLWPYIADILGINGEPETTPPVPLDSIALPEPIMNDVFISKAKSSLKEDQIRTDNHERLIHAYGKSFRDLWRIRRGIVDAAPDCVIYPNSEEEIVQIVRLAAEKNVILIPFGGGSNIAGCVEATQRDRRMVVSLDMKRMRRLLHVDQKSCTATIEAGVLGPDMEDQLQQHGMTLGHFPDSFEYSTLGGWIATRSAGMQSDKYGKIEDMVISLRMVTPEGTIVTRTVPKSSNGIDINHLCIGSEGMLGVITQAVMQVHRIPQRRASYGYLFPDFESGVNAIYRCFEMECQPSMVRLNDPVKTALSFAYKSKTSGLKAHLGKAVKGYLKHVKRFDFDKACLLLVIFEGERRHFLRQRSQVDDIYKEYGAVNLGREPGKAFERGKYDFPYLRDYVMDRNIMADVSETSTVWSNLLPLYYATYEAIEQAIRDTGSDPFVGCHISHSYHTGTSLYFTFGCVQKQGRELEQYLYVKKAAEDAFMQNGGTLSHHHAVGYEHMPWIEDDISETGIKAVQALKSGLDPKGIMNPGKIVPPDSKTMNWGLTPGVIEEFGNGRTKTTVNSPQNDTSK